MSEVKDEMLIVPRRSPTAVKWFDGNNVVEVAQWLVGHGTRAEVEFHQFGENLKVSSRMIDAAEGHRDGDKGVWVTGQGTILTKKQVTEDYEEVFKR